MRISVVISSVEQVCEWDFSVFSNITGEMVATVDMFRAGMTIVGLSEPRDGL